MHIHTHTRERARARSYTHICGWLMLNLCSSMSASLLDARDFMMKVANAVDDCCTIERETFLHISYVNKQTNTHICTRSLSLCNCENAGISDNSESKNLYSVWSCCYCSKLANENLQISSKRCSLLCIAYEMWLSERETLRYTPKYRNYENRKLVEDLNRQRIVYVASRRSVYVQFSYFRILLVRFLSSFY